VHSGGSANKAVDITKRNTDIIVFISLPFNAYDEVAWLHAITCISTKSESAIQSGGLESPIGDPQTPRL